MFALGRSPDVIVVVDVELSATLLFWKRRGEDLPFPTFPFIPTWNKGITRAVWADLQALAPNLTDT